MTSVVKSVEIYKNLSSFVIEEVTRDFAYGETDRLIRKCRLLPWLSGEVLDSNHITSEPSDDHYQV